jgi:uncharacterized membrane protein YczE
VCRGSVEVSVLAVGWLLGGTVGIGTLAFAFGIGPLVGITLPLFDTRRLQRTPRAQVPTTVVER